MVLKSEHGFTLIELIIASAMGIIVSFVAFTLLLFTQNDTRRISEQIHIDQTARVSLENLMLELHSGCVVKEEPPVQKGSTTTKIKFISEHGQEAAFTTIKLHEVTYTASTHKLTEVSYKSKTGSTYGDWEFETTPSKEVTLATHVEPTISGGKEVPIFRYYQYYQENPSTHLNEHPGELEPEVNPLKGATGGSGLSEEEAENVSKVTVGFSLAAERTLGLLIPKATQLEDSAIYRLTPTSTLETAAPEPCA